MRVLVAWCPDWSVVAGLAEQGLPGLRPGAVLKAGRVEVCNEPAREDGVRRGMRRRDAQSRCPELALLEDNPARDARAFEPVVTTIEQSRPGVAALRPGLVAVRAPAGWFGSEQSAAAVITEELVDLVWDVRMGVADDLFTAEQAARRATTQEHVVVPPGGSARFLAGLPVTVLEADGPAGREAASLLARLGLRTLGDLAGLRADDVVARFGEYGLGVWRRARGEGGAVFAARQAPPELACEIAFEPPLEDAEAVCFSVRTTAERFLAGLAAQQLVATGVRVEAESEGRVVSSRPWLHPRHFSARDLIDRVHWQLQAGPALRSRREAGTITAPIERVRFLPESVEPAAAHAEALWGGGSEEFVERGVARVQAMVGFDAVRQPAVQGGRTPAARQASAPWGERVVPTRPRDRPWPGAIPGPAPVVVYAEPRPIEVTDAQGHPVPVLGQGPDSPPARMRIPGEPWQPVAAWAGPWPLDEGWWEPDAPGLRVRYQVVGVDGRAWLLVGDPRGWWLEAAYD